VPVSFLGMSCWAVASIDPAEHKRRRLSGTHAVVDRSRLADEVLAGQRSALAPPLRLHGGLVEAKSAESGIAAAGLLAGYAPRAVLIQDQPSLLGLLTDAAVLDVGVVLNTSNSLQLLSAAGPRVRGVRFDAREWLLLETVYAAILNGASVVTAA
jgi:hypothetical protein